MPRDSVARRDEPARSGSSSPLLDDPASFGLELVATLPYDHNRGLFGVWRDVETGDLVYGHDVRVGGGRPFAGLAREWLLRGDVETIAVNALAVSPSRDDLRAFRARVLGVDAGLPPTLDAVTAASHDATVAEFRLVLAVGEARLDGHSWNDIIAAMSDFVGRAFREHERDVRESLAVVHFFDAEEAARKLRAQTLRHDGAGLTDR